MVIIFHINKLNLLIFFCLQIYLNINNNNFNEHFHRAKKSFQNNNIKNKSQGFLINYGHDNDDNQLYLLERGKGKNVVENSIRAYWQLFSTEKSNLCIFDLSPYNNILFEIGFILHYKEYKFLSSIICKKACFKIYKKLKKDLKHL